MINLEFKSLLCFVLILTATGTAFADCPVDLGPNLESCEGESITLDAETGDPGDTYQWFMGGSPIPGAVNSTLIVTQTAMYSVEVDDGTQTCTDDISVLFNTLPAITAPSPIELCDDEIPDGITAFDLTVSADEITGGNINLEVSWHETLANAQANIPIADPTSYFNLVNPQTIYVRVEDIGTACLAFTNLTLVVIPAPSPVTPTPLEVCDDDNDGFAEFNLNDKDAEIIGGEPNVVVSYHVTLSDAFNDILPLSSPYNNDVPSFQIVYARVENLTSGCFTVVELELVVLNSPIILENITPIFIDEGDGDEMAIFDLTIREAEILSDQDPTGFFELSYYISLADASSQVNAIANPTAFANMSNPQTIYVAVEDQGNGCFGLTNFVIITDGPGVPDADGDGVPDLLEDVNGNGNLNDDDTDMDTIPNYQDADDDGDTVDTIDEITGIGAGAVPGAYTYIDTDGNFVENYLDDDDDGDGTLTEDEDYNDNGTPLDDDLNENGIPDFLDPEVLGLQDNALADLQLYPNPASTELMLRASVFATEVSVTFFGVNGVEVLSEVAIPENQSLRLNVSHLNAGLYFVRIESEGASTTKKLLMK